MSQPIADLNTLLASMSPELNERPVAYVSVADRTAVASAPADAIIGTFREAEGLTLIVDAAAAEQAGLPVLFRAAWITLTVHSDLAAVGLTAAFAAALGEAGISCNVVAAAFHDHIFVPEVQADAALSALHRLQKSAMAGRANDANLAAGRRQDRGGTIARPARSSLNPPQAFSQQDDSA